VGSWALFFFFFGRQLEPFFCGLGEERRWASSTSFVGILGLFWVFFFFFFSQDILFAYYIKTGIRVTLIP
jgi:hypothetical protein